MRIRGCFVLSLSSLTSRTRKLEVLEYCRIPKEHRILTDPVDRLNSRLRLFLRLAFRLVHQQSQGFYLSPFLTFHMLPSKFGSGATATMSILQRRRKAAVPPRSLRQSGSCGASVFKDFTAAWNRFLHMFPTHFLHFHLRKIPQVTCLEAAICGNAIFPR